MNRRSSPTLKTPTSHRARERTERRGRILEAAERVFGQRGYHDASIAEIARAAGFAAGTIYLYFEDKADLYGHLLLEKVKTLVDRVEDALAHTESAPAALRAGVHAQFSFHDANRTFFEIFLNQNQLQSSPLHQKHWDAMERLKKRNRTNITKCVTRGQERGELKAGDAHLYAVAYLGVTLQMIRQWIREDGKGPLQASADFAADCFLHGSAAPTKTK